MEVAAYENYQPPKVATWCVLPNARVTVFEELCHLLCFLSYVKF